jgi:hypothetical protein
MADSHQHDKGTPASAQRRRRSDPIRVLPPDVVPLTKQDEQQAIAAIAAMIAAWWHDHRHHPDE